MKKAIAIAAMAVLATSVLLAASVGAVNAQPSEVEAKGKVTDFHFEPADVDSSQSTVRPSKWKVELHPSGQVEAKFEAIIVAGEVKIESVGMPSSTDYGTVVTPGGGGPGVLTVTFDGTVASHLKVTLDEVLVGNYSGRFWVNTNDGSLLLNLWSNPPTYNLTGTIEKVELEY